MVLPILTGVTPWAPEDKDIEPSGYDKPISAKAQKARNRLSSDNKKIINPPETNQGSDQEHPHPPPKHSQTKHYTLTERSMDTQSPDQYAPMDEVNQLAEHPQANLSRSLGEVEPFEPAPPAPNSMFSQFGGTILQSGEDNSNTKNSFLIKKLDYLISLLESQQSTTTDTQIEEILLYLFLGIFIIYVIDSFATVAKYTR